MRLLHVSDWHIGKMNGSESRAADHDIVLTEIQQIVEDTKPDLIIHTGDLFNQPRPGDSDMFRAIQALKDLERVAPVVVVRGNHDSDRLFAVFRRLYDGGNIIFVDKPRAPKDGGILEFPAADGNRIRLATLPFIHANRVVKDAFLPPADVMAMYADRIAWYEELYAQGLKDGVDWSRDVLLFGAHLYVTGSRVGKSEWQAHITDTYATRAEQIPQGISYAAFGHIHKPQRLPGSTLAHYAGSPIQMDFGEEGEQKSVVLVEAKPGEPATATTIPISGGRRLVCVSGTLEELQSQANALGNAILRVSVKSEAPLDNLAERVRDVFPEATVLDVRPDCAGTKARSLSREDATEMNDASMEDLFRTYIASTGTKGASVDKTMAVFQQLHNAVEEHRTLDLPALTELEECLAGAEHNATITA
jgi:DNA repair protein SbcD/Mre11